MSMNPFALFFAWIRTRSRNAVVAGFQDVVELLEEDDPQLAGTDPLAALRERLSRLALPAPIPNGEPEGAEPAVVNGATRAPGRGKRA